MKFSVILPVFNRAHCVVESIESVMRQSFSDWELIAVDDGSSDNSLEVLKEFAECEPRIKVIHQDNKGSSGARNSGMRAAEGEYILFLDSDDCLVPDAMKDLSKTIEQFNMPDMICAGFKSGSGGLCLPDGSICNKRLDKEYIYKNILPEHVNVRPQGKCFLQPFAWNKCYRREFIEKSQTLFDESRRIWEDNPFVVSCLAVAESLVIKQFPVVEYRDTDSGDRLSALCNTNMLYGYIKSYAEYKEQFSGTYNFNNAYTNRRYFSFLCNILFRLRYGMMTEEYFEVIDNVFKDGSVAFWMKNVKPRSLNERRIKFAYNRGNKESFVRLLENNSQQDFKESIFIRLRRRIYGALSRIKRLFIKIASE